MLIRAFLAMCLLAGAAQANSVVTRVTAEWEQWRASQGNPAAVMVLMRGNQEMLVLERGLTASAPVHLQSTSKAITAVCVEALVREGWFTYQTQLSQIWETGSDLTLGELIAQTSGLGPDETQQAMPGWYGQADSRWHDATQTALGRWSQQGQRGRYGYNNENYAILGAAIETVTGEPYELACQMRVLDPIGISSSQLDSTTGSFGPWGGWKMSARDYARFHRAYFVGRDPRTGPHAQMGGGAMYGMGMVGRVMSEGNYAHWHFGLLCFSDASRNGGSFTVSWGQEWSLFTAYSACVNNDAMVALDQAMVRAVFSQ